MAELAEKNPNLTVLGEYIGHSKAILHRCNKHGIEWNTSPANALRGCGCNKCKREKIGVAKQRTHDEYIQDLAEKNPNLSVLEIYIDNDTKILHRCNTHGVEWEISPNNALSGRGCYKCGREKISQCRKGTHEEYVSDLAVMNPDLTVLGTYIDAKTKILHRCNIHGIEWLIAPYEAKIGHGCKQCRSDKLSKSSMLPLEDFLARLSDKNPTMILAGEYNGIDAKTTFYCTIHDEYYDAWPASILRGTGCKKCSSERLSKSKSKTHEEYLKELAEKNPNVIPLEEYKNSFTKILHRCLIHGVEWEAYPPSIENGSGCKICHSERTSDALRMTQENYIKLIMERNKDVKLVGTYAGSSTRTAHYCVIHDVTWDAYPSSIKQGGGCPQCIESIGERMVRQYLEKHSIKYIPQQRFDDCRYKNTLPIDFFLPEHNKAIEFDGIQHFEQVDFFGGDEYFNDVVKRDAIKNEYCKEHGIDLLRIPYYANVEEELNKFLFA